MSATAAGSDSLDYTSPAFILQNINLEERFEVFENFSSEMRLRVIRNICDQVCFYVSCVLKAFLRSERAPSIVIYGAGFLGSTIINALTVCGCRSFLRVFTRDKSTIQIWRNQGIKASSKLKEGSFVDILILASNLSSFVQFCRDMSPHISPKTFIISTVFGLRRMRLFNILGTPGIFKTFVERRVALPSGAVDTSPSKKHLNRSLSSPINVQRGFPPPVSLDPITISARFLAGRKDGVRNLIIILENYLILSGIPALTARADALDSVVGADSLHSVPLSVSDYIGDDGGESQDYERAQHEALMAQRSDSSDSLSSRSKPPTTSTRRTSLARALTMQPDHHASLHNHNEGDDDLHNPNNPLDRADFDDDLNSLSSVGSTEKKVRSNRRNALIQAVPRHIKILRHAIQELTKAYAIAFKQELSKHILVIDLPTLPKESGDNFVFNALKKQKKATDRAKRSLIGRTPTRGIIANSTSNWQDYFLKDDSLLAIFACDSRSSGTTDIANPFVSDLDEQSEGENDENEEEAPDEDDPFGEQYPLQKQFYERYYIKKSEEDDGMERTTAPMNLQGLNDLTFDSLAQMMETDGRAGGRR
jgi:hypothetical protein